jgi:hypothetical protein
VHIILDPAGDGSPVDRREFAFEDRLLVGSQAIPKAQDVPLGGGFNAVF